MSCSCSGTSHLNDVDLPGLEVHLQQALEASRVAQPRDQCHQKFLDLCRQTAVQSKRPRSVDTLTLRVRRLMYHLLSWLVLRASLPFRDHFEAHGALKDALYVQEGRTLEKATVIITTRNNSSNNETNNRLQPTPAVSSAS